MRDSIILEKAIKKAIDSGMKYYGKPENGWGVDVGQWHTSDNHLCQVRSHYDHYIPYRDVIFNHEFAKALWGKEIYNAIDTNARNWSMSDIRKASPAWMYHLREMVISEEPIKYLGDNI